MWIRCTISIDILFRQCQTVNLEEACRQVQDFQQSQRQQLQEELARTEQALEETKQEIAAMKTSKFLKLKAIFS